MWVEWKFLWESQVPGGTFIRLDTWQLWSHWLEGLRRAVLEKATASAGGGKSIGVKLPQGTAWRVVRRHSVGLCLGPIQPTSTRFWAVILFDGGG